MAKILAQVVAIDKTVKSRVYSAVTELHKKAQKSDLYSGMFKEYAPIKEGGETLPAEAKKVQLRSDDVLKQARTLWSEHWDLEASKDWSNMGAKASVEIDGAVVIANAPVTFLLFLEKQLNDMRTFVEAIPVLPEDKDWNFDEVQGLYKTPVRQTHRTTKEQTPIVLYDAVVRDGQALPAQTQIITKDVLAGYWSQTEFSGAMKRADKEVILARLNRFSDKVKEARHAANETQAVEAAVAENVFRFILGK